jgi:hypothetical protein
MEKAAAGGRSANCPIAAVAVRVPSETRRTSMTEPTVTHAAPKANNDQASQRRLGRSSSRSTVAVAPDAVGRCSPGFTDRG